MRYHRRIYAYVTLEGIRKTQHTFENDRYTKLTNATINMCNKCSMHVYCL